MPVKKVSVMVTAPDDEVSEGKHGRFQIDQVREDDAEEQAAYQNTYIPQNNKTLSQLTREALPLEKHYEDSVNRVTLPTMDYLHNRTFVAKSKTGNNNQEAQAAEAKIIKFGWIEGVLIPCLLNIWGVMLFLRLSWVVGQTGIWQGFLLITVANVVTFITALSMSAVCTNGQIKGGGIYYMISRSLGPEFGAAIGLMFTLANSIAIATYIIGFCESLNDLLRVNDWGEIVDGGINDTRIIGTGVLVCILILAYVGMQYVSKTQIALLVILLAAEVNFMVGTFIGPVNDQERAQGFTGFKTETWNDNFGPDYRVDTLTGKTTKESFFSVFGVFFPAVTGIVAGANLSGNLKDPASAIPKGTLLAIAITYCSYIGFALMMGGSVVREATGDVDQYLAGLELSQEEAKELGFWFYTQCQNGTENICKYGLLNNSQVMELASSWGPLIYMGCFAATLSSAIASLIGAPRVLQALAKDRLYPLIHFFAKGYGKNNDPIRGYLVVFVVALGCTLIGKLNAIAPLQSNFFLAAYCLINFSCFHGSISKSPGWRPAFKYYNAWLSLFGSILCVAVMFLMSWVTALITVGVSAFLYMYVSYRKPNVNWGSSTQAQSYNSALSSVQTLNLVEEHVKNYRPQILILTGMPSSRPTLIDFSHLLVRNLSLFICGHVVQDRLNQKARNQLTRQARSWLAKHKKKGFYSLYEKEYFDEGARSIMQLAGLGKLKPNLTLMGYKHNWRSSTRQEVKEYVNVIHEALSLHLAVGILRIDGGLDYSHVIFEEGHMTMDQILDLAKPAHVAPTTKQESDTDSDEISSEEEDVRANPSPKLEKKAQEKKTPKKAKKNKKDMASLYQGQDGSPLPNDTLETITRFTRKQAKGTIDVWWLYDDGGITILLPYILSTRSEFSDCKLRIFTITSRLDQLGSTQRNMAALLSKFRIDYSDVIVIPDITAKAKAETKKMFEDIISPFKDDDVEDGTAISSAEMVTQRERINRSLRLHELLQEHSKDASFVVMTLPIPRLSAVSPAMYMGWLEIITKHMPPFLLVRGNQTSVLTFFS